MNDQTTPLIKYITQVCYRMNLGCGFDIWGITGSVNGIPRFISVPVAFDEQTDIIHTMSGSVYQVVSYDGNKASFVEQIRKDIVSGGYESH